MPPGAFAARPPPDYGPFFTVLGRHYAWASPERVAAMTVDQAEMYLRGVARNLRREQHGALLTASAVYTFMSAFGGSKAPTYEELLPDFLRDAPDLLDDRPAYSWALIEALEGALTAGDISAGALALLNTDKLRRSGWGRR